MASLGPVDEIDLNEVSERLHSLFEHRPPSGYLRGKTSMRNALEQSFECSELEAEEMVDTLESRGFIRFDGDPTKQSDLDNEWTIETGREE